jgi:RNA polymerase sigma factor (sigma-70 family)
MGSSNGAEGRPMSRRFVNPVLHFLQSFAGQRAGGDATDELLLRLFAAGREDAAFTALVHRHGDLVLSVCRRVLGNGADAEDAFQATFLVLARQAATGFRPRALACWLHGVAYRTARRALKDAAIRRERERQAVRLPAVEPDAEAVWADVRRVLDEEINGLPEKFRAPFVLCHLQGKTNAAAAEELGCPKGTVLSRLATARERLRARLERRGVTLSAAALGTLLARELEADTLAPGLASLAVRTALRGPVGGGAAARPPASAVEALAEGAVQATGWKLRAAVLVLVLAGVLTLGRALNSGQAGGRLAGEARNPEPLAQAVVPAAQEEPPPEPPEEAPPDERLPLPPGAVARLGWPMDFKNGSNGRSPQVAFSPDGKRFAAAAGLGVRVWEVASGRLLHQLSCPTIVHTLAFGPGNTLLGATHGAARVWDLATGKETRSFPVPEGWVSAAFSPDGRLLAAAERVWDVATGKELYRPEGTNADVSFSPDGRLLLVSWTEHTPNAAVKYTGRLRVLEPATGKVLRSHDHPGEAITYATLSPDGKTLAAGGYTLYRGQRDRYYVRLLDLKTGKETRRMAEGDYPRIQHRFSPDGKYLTVVHGEAAAHLWEVATGKPLHKFSRFNSLAFSPDSKTVAGTWAGRIHFWDVRTGRPRALTPGHWSWVSAVAFTPDGKSLVSAAVDEVFCWDLRRRTVTKSFKLKAPHLEGMTVAADGRHLLLYRGGVFGYDLERGTEADAFKDGAVWCYSADGSTLVRTGPPIPGFRCLPYKRDPAADAYPFMLTPSGDILVERLTDNSIPGRMRRDGPIYTGLRLRDSTTGEEIVTLKKHPAGSPPPGAGEVPLAFSPDGKMMAGLLIPAEHGERTIVLWETQTGQERLRLGAVPKYNGAALTFSPDGRILAFSRRYVGGPSGGQIHLLDLTLGKEVHTPLSAAALCLAFSRDGKLLASGNEDTTVLLWDATRFAAPPRAEPLPAEEFERLWRELAAADGGKAYRAMCRLLASPGPAVKLLGERLTGRDLAPAVNRLLTQLGSEEFKAREKAAADLEALGDRVRPFLKKAFQDVTLTLEQSRRVKRVLERLGGPFSSAAGIRLFRAVEILECVRSAEAVALLRQLAAGPEDDPLAREARRALARLRRRG